MKRFVTVHNHSDAEAVFGHVDARLPELIVNAKHDPALAEVSDEMDKVEEEIATIFEKARVRRHTSISTFTRPRQPHSPFF